MNRVAHFHYSALTTPPSPLRFTLALLLILLCLFCSPPSLLLADQGEEHTDPITGVMVHPGLGSAREAAAADNSLILLLLEMTGCKECNRVKKETIGSPIFTGNAGKLHVTFININEQQRYASDFQVRRVPDLILMTPEGEIVNRAQGFQEVKTLLEMVTQARQNKLEGKWFHSEDTRIITSQQSISELISLLGSSNPLVRARATELLSKSDRNAIAPLLIKTFSDPYLGLRVGAWELFHNWAPSAPQFDPWGETESREKQCLNIDLWWQDLGTLPPMAENREDLNQSELHSIEEAIAIIQQRDPARLPGATTKLRSIGTSCLPLLRSAIEKNASANREESVRILESIRWSIIIPDTLEQKVRARHDLAWGTNEQRLEAIRRLGSGGPEATGVLAELTGDSDSLIRENVAHALGKIGNKAALDTLAVLLRSDDPNTRMVAAQELGKTKNELAGQYLSAVVTDPDELVAGVAIAAMEECKAKKQAAELLATLTDPRWRVRAAGARALGKMEYMESGPELITLLHDEDPFVIKTALEALIKINALPAAEEIEPLFTKHPDLTVTITKALLAKEGKAVSDILTKIFNGSSPLVRREIMTVLGKKGIKGDSDIAGWKPLFEAALKGDEETRSSLVQVLKKCPPDLAAPFINSLLADPAAKIRTTSSELILQVSMHYHGIESNWQTKPDFNILSPDPSPEGIDDIDSASSRKDIRAAVSAKLQKWHELLRPILAKSPSLTPALAFWLTGDGTEGLERLPPLLKGEKSPAEQEIIQEEQFAVLIVKHLPWPEGRVFLEAATALPHLSIMLGQAASQTNNEELKDYLHDPQRISTLFQAPEDDRTSLAISAVLADTRSPMFLASDTPRNRLILAAMIESESSLAKTLAISCYAHFSDDQSRNKVKAFITDPDQWIRYATIQALIIQKTDQETLEELLAPLLHDPEPTVATMAAVGLLDLPLRNLMGLKDMVYEFRHDEIKVRKAFNLSYNYYDIERPFTPVTTKPNFLDTLRQDLLFPEKLTERQKYIYPVLLGQYGIFNAFRATLQQWNITNDEELERILLIAPQFSGEAAFLQPLKVKIENTFGRDDLRNLLKNLRNTPGEAARELRREINGRIRSVNGKRRL